jgi:hypothetical protein
VSRVTGFDPVGRSSYEVFAGPLEEESLGVAEPVESALALSGEETGSGGGWLTCEAFQPPPDGPTLPPPPPPPPPP